MILGGASLTRQNADRTFPKRPRIGHVEKHYGLTYADFMLREQPIPMFYEICMSQQPQLLVTEVEEGAVGSHVLKASQFARSSLAIESS